MFGRTIFDDLIDFRRNFDQLFNAAQNTRPTSGGERTEWNFSPAVETGWTDDFLNLRVVVPAVSQNDLKMTVQGSQLTIQGERRAPEEFGKEGTVYSQMPYGRFERVLDLPAGLDLDKLQAHLHDGVLDIRIPVAAAQKPKQVPISVGSGESKKTLAA
jgi:HSP20 family protein